MEVILLEKVDNLGNIGDKVRVRPGYGRNFLLPKGKATLATPENIAELEERRAELEHKQADELATAQARGARLESITLRLEAKAGSEGKLFGSIGTIDIAEACTAAGVPIERSEVRLPDGPLRLLGQHQIEIHLHADVTVPVHAEVVADETTANFIDVDAVPEDEPAAGTDDDQGAEEAAQQ